MGKMSEALLTADVLVHMKFNDLFKHWLHLIFPLIWKILIKFEDTFNTEKAKKILKGRTESLTRSYNRGGKKCCTAPYVSTHFWKDLVRPIKHSSTRYMTG